MRRSRFLPESGAGLRSLRRFRQNGIACAFAWSEEWIAGRIHPLVGASAEERLGFGNTGRWQPRSFQFCSPWVRNRESVQAVDLP